MYLIEVSRQDELALVRRQSAAEVYQLLKWETDKIRLRFLFALHSAMLPPKQATNDMKPGPFTIVYCL